MYGCARGPRGRTEADMEFRAAWGFGRSKARKRAGNLFFPGAALHCRIVFILQRAELDRLIYNDQLSNADLIPNGEPEKYLKAVTAYKLFED
jgi:hypothetical protein